MPAVSKRKSSPASDVDEVLEKPKKRSKKQAVAAAVEPPTYPSQPTNLILPIPIIIPRKEAGTTRIAAWNVCGLASCSKKGFKFYVEAEEPDILVLTETKMSAIPVDPVLDSRFPYRYWSMASKKGYSGTAILSKHEPLSVSYTLPLAPDLAQDLDADVVKGRIITLEFENSWLVGTYVPNAGEKLKTLSTKEAWNRHLTKYLQTLDKSKPVIWTGDLNVAPTALDLTNSKRNWNKTAGYTESETTAFANILSEGKMVDAWRQRHPTWQHYSYFSYRFRCREKGIGWRLDTYVVSDRLMEKVHACEIRNEIYGASDHLPVTLDLLGDL